MDFLVLQRMFLMEKLKDNELVRMISVLLFERSMSLTNSFHLTPYHGEANSLQFVSSLTHV